IVAPAGKPCMLTTAVPTALVTAPDASLVVTNVIVTVPDAVDSAFVIGGVSFDGRSCAVNVGLPDVVGAVLELPQAVAATARTMARAARFIESAPCLFRSEKFAREVEAKEQTAWKSTARQLCKRGSLRRVR